MRSRRFLSSWLSFLGGDESFYSFSSSFASSFLTSSNSASSTSASYFFWSVYASAPDSPRISFKSSYRIPGPYVPIKYHNSKRWLPFLFSKYPEQYSRQWIKLSSAILCFRSSWKLPSFFAARYWKISLRDLKTESGATMEITSGMPAKKSKIGCFDK